MTIVLGTIFLLRMKISMKVGTIINGMTLHLSQNIDFIVSIIQVTDSVVTLMK